MFYEEMNSHFLFNFTLSEYLNLKVFVNYQYIKFCISESWDNYISIKQDNTKVMEFNWF